MDPDEPAERTRLLGPSYAERLLLLADRAPEQQRPLQRPELLTPAERETLSLARDPRLAGRTGASDDADDGGELWPVLEVDLTDWPARRSLRVAMHPPENNSLVGGSDVVELFGSDEESCQIVIKIGDDEDDDCQIVEDKKPQLKSSSKNTSTASSAGNRTRWLASGNYRRPHLLSPGLVIDLTGLAPCQPPTGRRPQQPQAVVVQETCVLSSDSDDDDKDGLGAAGAASGPSPRETRPRIERVRADSDEEHVVLDEPLRLPPTPPAPGSAGPPDRRGEPLDSETCIDLRDVISRAAGDNGVNDASDEHRGDVDQPALARLDDTESPGSPRLVLGDDDLAELSAEEHAEADDDDDDDDERVLRDIDAILGESAGPTEATCNNQLVPFVPPLPPPEQEDWLAVPPVPATSALQGCWRRAPYPGFSLTLKLKHKSAWSDRRRAKPYHHACRSIDRAAAADSQTTALQIKAGTREFRALEPLCPFAIRRTTLAELVRLVAGSSINLFKKSSQLFALSVAPLPNTRYDMFQHKANPIVQDICEYYAKLHNFKNYPPQESQFVPLATFQVTREPLDSEHSTSRYFDYKTNTSNNELLAITKDPCTYSYPTSCAIVGYKELNHKKCRESIETKRKILRHPKKRSSLSGIRVSISLDSPVFKNLRSYSYNDITRFLEEGNHRIDFSQFERQSVPIPSSSESTKLLDGAADDELNCENIRKNKIDETVKTSSMLLTEKQVPELDGNDFGNIPMYQILGTKNQIKINLKRSASNPENVIKCKILKTMENGSHMSKTSESNKTHRELKNSSSTSSSLTSVKLHLPALEPIIPKLPTPPILNISQNVNKDKSPERAHIKITPDPAPEECDLNNTKNQAYDKDSEPAKETHELIPALCEDELSFVPHKLFENPAISDEISNDIINKTIEIQPQIITDEIEIKKSNILDASSDCTSIYATDSECSNDFQLKISDDNSSSLEDSWEKDRMNLVIDETVVNEIDQMNNKVLQNSNYADQGVIMKTEKNPIAGDYINMEKSLGAKGKENEKSNDECQTVTHIPTNTQTCIEQDTADRISDSQNFPKENPSVSLPSANVSRKRAFIYDADTDNEEINSKILKNKQETERKKLITHDTDTETEETASDSSKQRLKVKKKKLKKNEKLITHDADTEPEDFMPDSSKTKKKKLFQDLFGDDSDDEFLNKPSIKPDSEILNCSKEPVIQKLQNKTSLDMDKNALSNSSTETLFMEDVQQEGVASRNEIDSFGIQSSNEAPQILIEGDLEYAGLIESSKVKSNDSPMDIVGDMAVHNNLLGERVSSNAFPYSNIDPTEMQLDNSKTLTDEVNKRDCEKLKVRDETKIHFNEMTLSDSLLSWKEEIRAKKSPEHVNEKIIHFAGKSVSNSLLRSSSTKEARTENILEPNAPQLFRRGSAPCFLGSSDFNEYILVSLTKTFDDNERIAQNNLQVTANNDSGIQNSTNIEDSYESPLYNKENLHNTVHSTEAGSNQNKKLATNSIRNTSQDLDGLLQNAKENGCNEVGLQIASPVKDIELHIYSTNNERNLNLEQKNSNLHSNALRQSSNEQTQLSINQNEDIISTIPNNIKEMESRTLKTPRRACQVSIDLDSIGIQIEQHSPEHVDFGESNNDEFTKLLDRLLNTSLIAETSNQLLNSATENGISQTQPNTEKKLTNQSTSSPQANSENVSSISLSDTNSNLNNSGINIITPATSDQSYTHMQTSNKEYPSPKISPGNIDRIWVRKDLSDSGDQITPTNVTTPQVSPQLSVNTNNNTSILQTQLSKPSEDSTITKSETARIFQYLMDSSKYLPKRKASDIFSGHINTDNSDQIDDKQVLNEIQFLVSKVSDKLYMDYISLLTYHGIDQKKLTLQACYISIGIRIKYIQTKYEVPNPQEALENLLTSPDQIAFSDVELWGNVSTVLIAFETLKIIMLKKKMSMPIYIKFLNQCFTHSVQMQEFWSHANLKQRHEYTLTMLKSTQETLKNAVIGLPPSHRVHKPNLSEMVMAKGEQNAISNRELKTKINNYEANEEELQILSHYMPCLNCGTKSTLACVKCQEAQYCSQNCQQAHWRAQHYRDCRPIPPY